MIICLFCGGIYRGPLCLSVYVTLMSLRFHKKIKKKKKKKKSKIISFWLRNIGHRLVVNFGYGIFHKDYL